MGYSFYDSLGYLLVIIAFIITVVADYFVNNRYHAYRRIRSKKGLTGQEVARIILDQHGLQDIYVTEVTGVLSDHYDPNRKVVRLSKDVFHGDSIASVSIAAHEVGHAIQHKEGYTMIKIRGAIFPFVSFASKFGYIAIFIGFIFNFLELAWAGIGLLLVILLFQLITLPVEFDASKRALTELESNQVLNANEIDGSRDMLKVAAMTYVAGVAATILEILRFVLLIIGRNDRN